MITRRKRKWALFILLVLLWASGIFGFLRLETVFQVKAEKLVFAPVNPVVGVSRDVGIPVLLYHGIVEQDDGENVTIADFREQMTSLRQNGYTALDTKDLYAYYRQGARLPDKPIVITFDDGRIDSYVNGDPVLGELGFKAVMFTVAEKPDIQDPFFLSWDQLREMHASGRWDIEAHAYDGHDTIPVDAAGNQGNYYSNKMWLASQNRLETEDEYKNRVQGDLAHVKADLENNLPGARVDAMAFPLGDYGQMSVNIDKKTAENDFLTAVKSLYALSFELNFTGSDFNNFSDSDPNLLRRFEVPSDLSAADLIKKLKDARPARLPYAVAGFGDAQLANWFCNWGTTSIEGDAMRLAGNEKESGGETILYGGHYWTDYSLSTLVEIQAGNAYVIGRYADDDNFVFCQISKTGIVLGQKINGAEKPLDSISVRERDEYPIELDFNGNKMTVKLEGKALAPAVHIDPSLGKGGVGFQAWNPEGGKASISVRKVIVTSNSQESREV